ncbi:hypothetical protein [Nonomuraea sp. LPB2021202275-12-8]
MEEIGVAAAAAYQLLVITLLDDPATVQEGDAVGALDRPHPVGHHHHRPAGHQALDPPYG